MEMPPEISESTVDERRDYVKMRYPCISDCDMCGLCRVFHGQDPELAYRDYIEGKASFVEVSGRYGR